MFENQVIVAYGIQIFINDILWYMCVPSIGIMILVLLYPWISDQFESTGPKR